MLYVYDYDIADLEITYRELCKILAYLSPYDTLGSLHIPLTSKTNLYVCG